MSHDSYDYTALVRETILFEMVSAAQAAGLPKGFIKNITLAKTKDGEYTIENSWSKDGKPLAKWFEYGTKRHYIQPKDPNGVLVWASGGPQSGHAKAIFSKRADNVKGQALFSKGHYVSGIKGYMPMTLGFRRGSKRMKELLALAAG